MSSLRPVLLLLLLLLLPQSAFAQTEEAAPADEVEEAVASEPAPEEPEAEQSIQLKACEEDQDPEPLPEPEPDVEDLEDTGMVLEEGDGSETAEASDLDEFRATHERFRARVAEFAGEVSRIIERQFDEEVAELREGYERLVGKADIEERMLREKAIEAHEKFIKDHATSDYTARRMFRLAELYFEVADEKFLQDNEDYNRLGDLFDAGKLEYLPEPPEKDYRKSIGLYKRIIRKFPDYEDLGAVYYMLGYAYSDEASRSEDPEKARKTYEAMVENIPDSAYRAQAYVRLADIHFEENSLGTALQYYTQILDEFEARRAREPESEWPRQDRQLFELALYKVAWAYYKLDDLEVAIGHFTDLIEWAERKEARTGEVGDLKPESVRYLAISLADLSLDEAESVIAVAERSSASPMQFAMDELDALGPERPWTFEVLAQVAAVLLEQARFEEAIDAYQLMQQRYPLAPEGPEFQNTVIVLYQNLPLPDLDGAARARVELTNRYGLSGKWYDANKNNKTAIAAATQYILESLQQVAYSYHTKAGETGDPNDYLLAARKYQEYLERYPFAKNAYELNFYLAETLLGAGESPIVEDLIHQAIDQYERLFGYPEDEFKAKTVEGIAYAYNLLWKHQDGDVTAIPEALANIKPPLGEKIEYRRLPLSETANSYLGAVRRLQQDDPVHEQLPVYVYDIGQLYFFHNQLPEARRIYEEIIAAWPESEFAASAAAQIVDSYLYTGQLSRMRASAARFAAMSLGQDAGLATAQLETFGTLEKKGLFKEGEIAYNEARYECAVEAFEAYYDAYGSEASDADPKNIDLVLYNVAQAYSKLGNTDRSNDYYEKLLAQFPHSDQAPSTFWKMASNYERILELEKAVKYYEEVATFHPGHTDTANAIFNAAFLKVGLGQYLAAAKAYEQYHGKYSELGDAKDVLFRSAELYETAGEFKASARVYQEWLDLYGAEDADLWMETQSKLARFAEDAGRDREATKRRDAITESYPELKDKLQGIGIRIAAELHIGPLLEEFEEYKLLLFLGDPEKDAVTLTRKAEWNVSLAQAFDDMVVEYPDFEWQSASLYYKGLTYKAHAASWLQAPIPPEVEEDPELFEVYASALQKQAAPLEKRAIDSFKAVVDFAKTKKRHNPWVDKALTELNTIDENTYPVFKPEEATVIESDTLDVPPPVEVIEEEASLHRPTRVLYAGAELIR